MKVGILAAIAAIQYVASIVMALGGCMTVDKIFRYRLKDYKKFVLLISLVMPVVLMIRMYYHYGVPDDWYIYINTAAIWFFLTDRSFKSFIASAAGSVFSFFWSYSLMVTVSTFLFGMLDGDHDMIVGLCINLFCNSVGLLFVWLLGIMAKTEVNEPLSIWNIIALAVISVVVGAIIMGSYGDSGRPSNIVFFGFTVIIMSIVVSVKSSEKNFYSRISRVNENYLNAQEKYYVTKQKSETEIRRVKHDIKNHMLCISELSRKGKYKELEEYVSELSQRLAEAEERVNTHNDIANAIINDKMTAADSKSVEISVSGELENANMQPIDICTILSNLLDNAIEAAQKISEGKRKIEVSFKQSAHFMFITVSNPTTGPVDTDVTTKSDTKNHGFGISNVRNAVQKYSGEVNFNCEKSDSGYIFSAEVLIPRDE